MFHTMCFGESSIKLTTILKAFKPNRTEVFANMESLKRVTLIQISKTYVGNGLSRVTWCP